MEFRDSRQAFNNAIRAGRLSDKPADEHYAGHYMYMGTTSGVDQFKHIDTREYLPGGQVQAKPVWFDRWPGHYVQDDPQDLISQD